MLHVTEQLKSTNELLKDFVLTDGSNNTVVINSQRRSSTFVTYSVFTIDTKSATTTNFDSLLKSLDNRIQIGMKEIETMEKTVLKLNCRFLFFY